MNNNVLQFGIEPKGDYLVRPSAYVVIFDDLGRILALDVGGEIHLPGGGIEKGESPESAVIREAWEEAGCEIADILCLGRANQYFSESELGPLNKLGIFFGGKLLKMDKRRSLEIDHTVVWLTQEEFLNSNAGEFQKWAARESKNNRY